MDCYWKLSFYQVDIFSSPNKSPLVANQNKIITRTVFPMFSLFDDLEKTLRNQFFELTDKPLLYEDDY